MYYIVFIFLLFFVLTPGILFSIPSGKSIKKKAFVHGVVFALIFSFIPHNFLKIKYREGKRGRSSSGTSVGVTAGSVTNLPNGPYKQSCEGCTNKSGKLSCNCKARNGKMNRTSIKGCNRDISNQDGKLTCG